ncbi:MAG: response regulator transcription factor [Spirochaetales bacterium]|nr:response regulator transcription factor [Spirochaetales bacterium]
MNSEKQTLLVVEDEKDILNLLSYTLENSGYKVICAENGLQGLSRAKANMPDLVLLDLMLPDLDGFEVCRKLKQDYRTSGIPIIMLTAKSEDSDIVSGLEIGADDYITKPFSPKVLEARIKKILNRGSKAGAVLSDKIIVHGITIDTARHEVLMDGEEVNLSATEFSILKYLAGHPGWVFSRDQIIDAERGEDYPVTERSVDVQILGIRRKLGDAGVYIETVRGVGYRMKSE